MTGIALHEKTYNKDTGMLYVEAIVDDMICTSHQTLLDPAEYGPALCSASMSIDIEDEDILTDEYVLQLIEEIDPDWTVIDTSDY